MGVQSFLKTAFRASLATMDAEEIEIFGQSVMAVIDERSASKALDVGKNSEERQIIVQYPAGSIHRVPKSGETVRARGETWQVSAEDGGVRTGQSAVTLVLVEPNRRRDSF